MKEKREIILFFTRLLMLAVMLAVLFGVIFGMTSAKNQDMSPKICAGDLLLYYRLERKYSDRDVVVFQKEGFHRIRQLASQWSGRNSYSCLWLQS